MNPDELAKFTLDNKLGGDSEFIHRKAIYRYVHVGVYTDVFTSAVDQYFVCLHVTVIKLASQPF